MSKSYDLTNAQVMDYLWRRERINDGSKTPQIERNRLRLTVRRLLFYGRGVILPFNRKERNKQEVKPIRERAGQGCA